MAGKSKVDDLRKKVTVDEIQHTVEEASSSKKPTDGVKTLAKKTHLEPLEVRKELQKPLTKHDVDRTLGIYDDLQKSDAYRRWDKSYHKLEKNNGNHDPDTIDKMRMMRDSVEGADAYRDVYLEFGRLVKKRGGYRAYMGSLVRMSGVAAAAEQIAKDHGNADPASDEVAGFVLHDRPAIKKEFQKTLHQARKMASRHAGQGTRNLGDMSALMMLQQPGTVAMARMPEKSFKRWKSFSVARRKKILALPKEAQTTFPAFLGIAVTGKGLIMTSELSAVKEAAK